MELRQLKYFLLVAEEKSIVRAAKKAFISQQALSKSIQNLEAELHGTLFTRNNTGANLTPLGLVLAKRAEQIIKLVDLTLSELNARDDNKKTLYLGIPYSILDLLNIDKLFEFQTICPNHEIRIGEVADKVVEMDVYYNYLDIGIVGGKGDFMHFDVSLLRESETFIAMHRDNPLARKDVIRLRDLREEVFITATKDYNAHDAFIEACARVGFTPRIGQQSGNIELIKQLVQMNKGIYPCPDNRVYLMNSPEIALREIEEKPLIYAIYMLTRKGKTLSRAVATFRDYIFKITSEDKTGWVEYRPTSTGWSRPYTAVRSK
jgi:DNA-binding transcriptional LysR family regulator